MIKSNSALSRVDSIMSMVDEWAEKYAMWDDGRNEAVAEVHFMLYDNKYSNWSDEMIADEAIKAWELAE